MKSVKTQIIYDMKMKMFTIGHVREDGTEVGVQYSDWNDVLAFLRANGASDKPMLAPKTELEVWED